LAIGREGTVVYQVDSRETTFERPRVSTTTVALRSTSYAMPQYRRHALLPQPAPPPDWRITVKRGIDIVVSLLLLVMNLPALLFAAIAIKLDSPGPILFRQRRIGLHGRPFELLKFRTMHCQPPDPGRLQQARPRDPRVTRVGAVLRHTSFDELPQLWNVLRGEMSLVGPRPHAPGTCAGARLFEEVSDRYPLRHRVRPGITGLAQVRGWRGQTETEEKLLRRLESDLEYVAGWSLWLDCVILARTVATVLRMRNAY
jgi:exopolysaccharide biosynthesis polyprenyl glycosylphosphotransferase